MRLGGTARLFLVGGLMVVLCHSVALAAARIRVAQTSNVTNCMMGCNSQAASCQITCLIPGHPADGRRNGQSQRQQEHGLSAQQVWQGLSCGRAIAVTN